MESGQISVCLEDDAVAHAIRLSQSRTEWEGLPLRLYIDGKGCSGFYYGLSFDHETSEDIRISQQSAADELLLITDKDTAPFVDGSVISWVDDERGCGFLVTNPRHKQFRGKFFRRKDWQQRIS